MDNIVSLQSDTVGWATGVGCDSMKGIIVNNTIIATNLAAPSGQQRGIICSGPAYEVNTDIINNIVGA